MNEELKKLLSKPAAPIQDVGRIVFDIGRKASYRAAENGSIPTIDVNGRKWVPTAILAKMLGVAIA